MALKSKHRSFLGAEWTILIQTGIGDHFCCFIATAFCKIEKSLILWRVVSEAISIHLTGSDTTFLLYTIRLLMSTLEDPRAFKLIWIASMILFDFPIANLHWRPFRCLNINLPRSDWVWSTKSDHTSSTAMASRWKRLYADINTLSAPLS